MLEPAEVQRWERLTDAMLRHAANDDPEALAQVIGVLDRAQAKLPSVVGALRMHNDYTGRGSRHGYSWAEIGAALGITRQSAAERFRLR